MAARLAKAETPTASMVDASAVNDSSADAAADSLNTSGLAHADQVGVGALLVDTSASSAQASRSHIGRRRCSIERLVKSELQSQGREGSSLRCW